MPIQLNDDTIDILYSNGTISYTIDKSYDDSNVISLLSTSNITFLEGGGGLNVNGNINFTGDLTKGGEVFSSYDDTDVISLLSTSNITLFNSNRYRQIRTRNNYRCCRKYQHFYRFKISS